MLFKNQYGYAGNGEYCSGEGSEIVACRILGTSCRILVSGTGYRLEGFGIPGFGDTGFWLQVPGCMGGYRMHG